MRSRLVLSAVFFFALSACGYNRKVTAPDDKGNPTEVEARDLQAVAGYHRTMSGVRFRDSQTKINNAVANGDLGYEEGKLVHEQIAAQNGNVRVDKNVNESIIDVDENINADGTGQPTGNIEARFERAEQQGRAEVRKLRRKP